MFELFLIPGLTAILGLVMIFSAEPIIKVLVIAFGFYALISGINVLVVTKNFSNSKEFKIACFVRAGINIIIGLLCIILPIAVIKFAWKTMMILIGIFSILSAIIELYSIFQIKTIQNDSTKKKSFIEVLVTFGIGVVAFLIPSSFGITLIKIAGGVLILIAIINAIYSYKNRPIIDTEATVKDLD